MANPLSNLFSQAPQQAPVMPNNAAIQSFQHIVQMLRTAKNPQAAIEQFAQQNPQMQQVLQMCSGKDPKAMFFEECQKRGIDPNALISQLGIR